ncbi:MAG TPA: energy transducer TonB [Candidatus Cloacimonadota bacterium]|nr:energy transducer TonB [Candidatus Cloacimonadota bacterium]HQB40702.1 energy transducer TonB [Candidatus Cloacimonadota bacterium]
MKDEQLSWLIAIVFHLLVLLFMLLFTIYFPPLNIIEKIEIIALDDHQMQSNNIVQDISVEEGLPAQNNEGNNNTQARTNSPKISLPSSTENYETAVKVHNLPMKRKKDLDQSLYESNVEDNLFANESNTGGSLSDKSGGVSNITSPRSNYGGRDAGISEGLLNYQLEGDAVNRHVLKKVLPKYPDNMQIDGTVRLQFIVLEDGNVGDITIVKKSDPIFENLAIQALNKWKFNRSDKKNTGIISFHFKLE